MNQTKHNPSNDHCNDPQCELTRTGVLHDIFSHKEFRPNSGWPWYFEPPYCIDKNCFKNKEGISHFEHECGKFFESKGTKEQNVLVGTITLLASLVFGITVWLGIIFGTEFYDAKINDFFVYGTLVGSFTSFALVFLGYYLYKKWELFWEPFPTYDFTYEEWLKAHRPPITHKGWKIFLGIVTSFVILFGILFVLSATIEPEANVASIILDASIECTDHDPESWGKVFLVQISNKSPHYLEDIPLVQCTGKGTDELEKVKVNLQQFVPIGQLGFENICEGHEYRDYSIKPIAYDEKANKFHYYESCGTTETEYFVTKISGALELDR